MHLVLTDPQCGQKRFCHTVKTVFDKYLQILVSKQVQQKRATHTEYYARNDKDTSWPASRNLGNGRLGKISHPDFRQKPGGQVRHSAKITADVPLLDPAMKRDPGRRTKSAKTGGQVVGIRNDRGLVVLSCWVFAKHLSFRRIRRRRRLRNLKLKGGVRFLGLSQRPHSCWTALEMTRGLRWDSK